jgi:predicted TIM-barrel fold metal-dependent hydrolase
MIIDIDSHFEPGEDWLEPYPQLQSKLPSVPKETGLIEGIMGDLLRNVPRDEWWPMDELMPPGAGVLLGREQLEESQRRAEFEGKQQRAHADAAARVKWLDAQGIDVQNVICLDGFHYTVVLEDHDRPLLREAIHTCNSWLADTCDPAQGRLLPVTTLEYSELDWAVAELTRMRARGSRIFLIPGYPVAGLPPCHPDWDRLWSAATDLGMTPMLHVGFERTAFDPGWANLGTDAHALRYFASSFGNVGGQTLLSSFIFNGVFERHPKLTLLLAELGVGWLPWVYREVDGRIDPVSQLFLGEYHYSLKPSEFIERNVRATPLSWAKDRPIPQLMRDLPDDVVVFSSDFPHFEGYADPMGSYRDQLSGFSSERLDRFYGGSMADVYARMGDPLNLEE